jgi:hypothetical protein
MLRPPAEESSPSSLAARLEVDMTRKAKQARVCEIADTRQGQVKSRQT